MSEEPKENTNNDFTVEMLVHKLKEVDDIYIHMERTLSAANISMVQRLLKRNMELMKFISLYQDSLNASSSKEASADSVVKYANSIQEVHFNLSQVR